MLDEQNIMYLIAAPVVTGVIGFIVARATRGWDARSAAEAALIGIGPLIIKEQNQRIDSLSTQIASLWKENTAIHVREQDCLDRLDKLERKHGDTQ